MATHSTELAHFQNGRMLTEAVEELPSVKMILLLSRLSFPITELNFFCSNSVRYEAKKKTKKIVRMKTVPGKLLFVMSMSGFHVDTGEHVQPA